MSAFTVRDGTFAMLYKGGYKLSPKALSIYWFFLYHGIWEPGHQWFGYVDIKMTSNQFIQTATGLSRDAVRRGLVELEEAGFIDRYKRHFASGVQANDSIALGVPEDWCQGCQSRGEHKCAAAHAGEAE